MARSFRPLWEGHLRLSLVTCPVALYKATDEGGSVHFHLLHPKSKQRVRQFWRDPGLPEGEAEIPRGELLHGYEIEKGHYVIIEDEDIRAIKLESTKTIQIERFVDAASIDRVYWDTPYYLAPSGKPDLQEPYAVIRDAMAATNRVGIGRVVMTGRERIVALEVRGRGLLMSTLHTAEEVRTSAELFAAAADAKPDPQMVEIARAIIGKLEGPFDPAGFTDRYEEALRALVAAKSEGAVLDRAETPADTNVIDLMEALRRSLAGPDKPKASAPAPKKRSAAETAAVLPGPGAKKPARRASKSAAEPSQPQTKPEPKRRPAARRA